MLYEISEKAEREISKYCDNYEIYLEKIEVLQVDSQKSNLSFAKEEINFGIGIRVINNQKLGFAYTSNMEKIEEVAEKAYLNSKLNEKDENFSFAYESKLAKVNNIYDSKFENLDIKEATDFLESIINISEEEGCEPSSGGFSSSCGESLIINSNNVSAYNKSTGFSAFIALNSEKNGEKSTAYDGISSCFLDIDGEKLARNTSKIAKNSIGGINVETKDMDVVLDYHAAVGLLGTFINSLNADNVQRGRSILADKVGKTIVDDNISIYDDGTLDGGLCSCSADGEGTPSKRTTLVEDGILNGFIYDMYTSTKANNEIINGTSEESVNSINEENVSDASISSTGNGFRGAYATNPAVTPSNVIFDFKEKINISEIESGFLATDVLGAHTANPISGDFSVEANNAFLIENGEIKEPVKKAMISGNIFSCLANCEGLKSEIKQYGHFIIPKIFCKGLRVVG